MEMQNKPKILMVDDVPENLTALHSIFKKTSIELHFAKSGNEALSLMLRNEYAVVLSDVCMPEMDGFELVSLMRNNPDTQKTPVILLTAVNKTEIDVSHGYNSGASDYVYKPIQHNILVKKVKVFIDLYLQRMALESQLQQHVGSFHNQAGFNLNFKSDVKSSVLIVDDKQENLYSMSKLLNKLDVDVCACDNGVDAISKIKENDFAVILLDVQMPGMTGFEVAEQLKKSNNEFVSPIIFVTAINRDDVHVERGYESGAVDYLFKPIKPEVLLSKVDAFVLMHQHRIALTNLITEKEGLIEDIKKKNEELGYLAYHDSLTLLANRKGFQDEIERSIYNAKRYQRKFAILFIDIDHFKSINDTYGHEYGDDLLCEVANQLKDIVRKSDFIARLGGDEFAVILNEIKSTNDAGLVAKKIMKRLSNEIFVEEKKLKTSVSIGIACYPDEIGDDHNTKTCSELVERIMRHADVAMYLAKKEGRGRYQYFKQEFSEKHKRHFFIDSSLHSAIDNEELSLVFQPKYYLKTKKMSGVEALLRWNQSEAGFISPAEFIPIAEESSVIHSIGEWVFERVCAYLVEWKKIGMDDIKVAVNVSTKQLEDAKLADNIHAILAKHNISSDQIEIEITETAVLGDSDLITNNILSLHDFGLSVVIDDFGTGYSVLSHLKKLPINGLKIDIEFVRDLIIDQSGTMITNAIIGLANNLSLNVVAEGIESEEQLNYLIENGCNMGQGYLFSKPLSPDDLINYLKKIPS